jgi:hypothetical protein
MPNESAETLKLIIHSLRVQLDEQVATLLLLLLLLIMIVMFTNGTIA